MDKFKFFRKDNYIVLVNDLTQVTQYGLVKEVMVDKSNANKASYRIFGVKDFSDKNSLVIDQLLKEDGSAYTAVEFETFYTQNTGNFNGGGTAPGIGEAPIDGLQYARQDATWSEVVGGGGSQDLQSVLLNNPISDQYITLTSNLETLTNISADSISFSEGGKGSGMSSSSIALYESGIGVEITKDFTKFSDGIKDFVITAGIVSYGNPYVRNSKLDFISLGSTNIVNLKLPFNKQTGEYTVSTLEDILSLGSLIPTYATNAAAITGGLVVDNIYKTATGELRIVV